MTLNFNGVLPTTPELLPCMRHAQMPGGLQHTNDGHFSKCCVHVSVRFQSVKHISVWQIIFCPRKLNITAQTLFLQLITD